MLQSVCAPISIIYFCFQFVGLQAGRMGIYPPVEVIKHNLRDCVLYGAGYEVINSGLAN